MEILLFANSASQQQMREIANIMPKGKPADISCSIGKATVAWHSDREPRVEIFDNVRNKNVVVIACTGPYYDEASGKLFSVNDLHVQTMALLDALYRASAKIMTVVDPYMAYLCQERRSGGETHRTSITAKLAAKHYTLAAPDLQHVCAIEPHTASIEGLFDCRFDAIPSLHLFAPKLREYFPNPDTCTVFSPDVGGVPRAAALATHCGITREPGHIVKRRPKPGQSKVIQVSGETEGLDVIFVDDLIRGAGTIAGASVAVRERGAKSVTVAASHGLFVDDALRLITEAPVDRVLVLDTIIHRKEVCDHPKIQRLSCAELCAQTIVCHLTGESIREIGYVRPKK